MILHRKPKKPTATKKLKNENVEVTIQMYSNLKKAINSIDEDVNQFTLRYEKVKEVVASKITEYIKKFNQSYSRRKQKIERRSNDCKYTTKRRK